MKTPWISLYPADFLADVGHLGNTELGIYWRLLLVYYRDARPLPLDTDKLRRLAMCFSPEEYRCLDAVVSEFFALSTESDGSRVWRHRRADKEISSAASRHDAAREKASAAAVARWEKARAGMKTDAASNAPSIATSNAESNACDMPTTTTTTTTSNTSPSEMVETQSVPNCPHTEIVKAFAEILPSARQPSEWNATRQALLRSRWAEKRGRQNVDWWRRFFEYIQTSDFLMGRSSSPGRKPFLLSLDWLLKSSNFLKVIEGAYHEANADNT